jgi:uncharacterized protein (TIGR02246 family)
VSLDPVALVRRYHDALNRYDAAVVTPMFAPDAVYVSPGVSGRIAGRDKIISAFNAYFAAHPDQRAEDSEIVRTGPFSARSRWRLEATEKPSGRVVHRAGTETVTFDAAGLITFVEVEDA